MTERSVQFHPAAEWEFEAAADWYAQRSKLAPLLFLTEVDRAVNLILQAPDRWPAGAYGTRSFVLHRFPYVLVYRDLHHTVLIVAVAHSRRRPNYWRDRL